MKGRNEFTRQEISEIRNLIAEKERATSNKQKGIRQKIRNRGFYWTDFYSAGKYTTDGFDELIRTRRIKVVAYNALSPFKPYDETTIPQTVKIQRSTSVVPDGDVVALEKKLMNERNFKSAGDIDTLVADAPGLYCIRIKESGNLSKLFRDALAQRGHNVMYIGIASKSLLKRFLGQELRAKGHGTFFRSIGAVIGCRPPQGSLKNKANKRNYTFVTADERKIIEWINKNLTVNWVEFKGDLGSIETSLIFKHKPLLNIAKNPVALQALKDLRKECGDIANS